MYHCYFYLLLAFNILPSLTYSSKKKKHLLKSLKSRDVLTRSNVRSFCFLSTCSSGRDIKKLFPIKLHRECSAGKHKKYQICTTWQICMEIIPPSFALLSSRLFPSVRTSKPTPFFTTF